MFGTPLAQVLAIGLGGAAGAVARWLVSGWLNPLGLPFAAGTWVVNCAGGLLIGVSLVWFDHLPNDLLRLLLVTGFLGGLTTFSAFSAESLMLLADGRFGVAALHTVAHVLGGLLCAALGWWLTRAALGLG